MFSEDNPLRFCFDLLSVGERLAFLDKACFKGLIE